MALKNLRDRLRPRASADGAKPGDKGADGKGPTNDDLAFEKRRADNIAAAAKAAQAKADAELKAAREETARVRLENELTQRLSAKRFINPGDTLSLVRDKFEIRDGKLVSKESPEKDADAVLDDWASTRKHMIGAAVQGGGSGAPGTVNTAGGGEKEPDLKTSEGATNYVRGLTHKAVEAMTPATPSTPKTSQ